MTQIQRLKVTYSIQQALHWMSVGIIIPVIVLLQQHKGLSLVQIGSVMGLYGIVIMLLEVPTGSLADLIGRKRVYLLSSAFKLSMMAILISSSSYLPVLVAFLLYGVSRALDSGSLDAWYVDELNAADPNYPVQEALATVEIAILCGLGVSSLFGGLIPDLYGRQVSQLLGLDLYGASLLTATALMILTTLFTIFGIRETTFTRSEQKISLLSQMGSTASFAFGNVNILLLLASTLILGLGYSTLETFWQPRVSALNTAQVGSWIYGVLSFGYFAAAGVGSAIMIRIVKRTGERYSLLMFLSRLIFGLLLIILSRAEGLVSFAILYMLSFGFNGAGGSVHNTLLNSHCPSQKRSTLLSLSSFALQGGGAVGSLAGGAIAAAAGIPTLWVLAGTLLSLSSLFYLKIRYGKSSE